MDENNFWRKTNCAQWKIHDYLGIDIDWSKDGKVTIGMIKYLNQILDEFIEEITKTLATMSADYLFKIREECDAALLPEVEGSPQRFWKLK